MKLVEALIVLLHSFTASADDHMFSYSMSMANLLPKADKGMGGMPKDAKADKGMGGGMIPGSKGDKLPDVSKGGMSDGTKAGKMDKMDKAGKAEGSGKGKDKYDGCQFANPLLVNVEIQGHYGNSTLPPEALPGVLKHQDDVNKMIFGPLVKKYVNREITPVQVAMAGAKASHPLAPNLGYAGKEICDNAFALVLQMANTCQDKKFLAAYANVAAALMSGFANPGKFGGSAKGSNAPVAGFDLNILECVYDGKTFREMFAKQLTEATIMTVDFGVSLASAPSQMPSGSLAPSLSPSLMPSLSSAPSMSAAPTAWWRRRLLEEEEEAVREDLSMNEVRKLIGDFEHLDVQPDATFSFAYDLISKASCDALIRFLKASLIEDIQSNQQVAVGRPVDVENLADTWLEFEDGGFDNQYGKKLYADDLVELIGREETLKILDFFEESLGDLPIDCMYLTRHAPPKDGAVYMVPWHIDDYATMEITLNDDYDGGDVLHVTEDGVHKLESRVGSVFAHKERVIHGITPNTKGAKYMLLLKHHFDRPDKDVRISREIVDKITGVKIDSI